MKKILIISLLLILLSVSLFCYFYLRSNIGGWKDIVAISAGSYHTIGLKKDGTVVAVGWKKIFKNGTGQSNVGSWNDIAAIPNCRCNKH